jgi:hypothetical protein
VSTGEHRRAQESTGEHRRAQESTGTENHHFNEFEMTILIVLQISRVSLLQDMLIDVQYTISIL